MSRHFIHDRFELLRCVHEGRLSAVYAVREPGLARELALKTVSPRAEGGQRDLASGVLRREAELRAALDHPAFAPLYSYEYSAGEPQLIGPWFSGGTVSERFRDRGSRRAVASLALHVGAGLDALHRHGFVHGDLSPRNIVFDGAGAPRILDLASCIPLGARRGDDAGESWAGGTTAIVAAPELWTGEPVDGRADLYSLATIAYFLLTGSWPFVADDRRHLRELHAHAPVVLPSTRCPLLGDGVDQVLLRALAKQPARRFASAGEFALALDHALDGPANAPIRPQSSLLTLSARPSAPARPRVDDGALLRAWKALERFTEGLPPDQRAAFTALVGAVERADAGASAATGARLRAAIAPIAALAAAEAAGLLHVLADCPQSAAELAEACDARPDTTARLCRFLRAAGHLGERNGRYELRPPLLGAYRQGRRLDVDVRPVHDTLANWQHLGAWLRSGAPAFAMDRDDSGAEYGDGAAYLGDACESQAAQLAALLRESQQLPERPALLDVGAGSAVWSLALCAAWPGAVASALDRPRVLDVAAARAQAAGLAERLTLLPGDWRDVPLAPAAFDLVILANFCHLHTADSLAELFCRLRPALAPRGRLVVVDTVPEDLAAAGEPALRYDLALALRTDHGRVHDRSGYRLALAAAGLELVHIGSLARGGNNSDVLIAAPSSAETTPS